MIQSQRYQTDDRCYWTITEKYCIMNTIELTAVGRKIAHKAYFLGVLPCDRLPKDIHHLPAMLVVNTEPAHLSGAHWLAVYITIHRQGKYSVRTALFILLV